MIFKQLKVGGMENFAYIIGDEETGVAALVDPAWEIERILSEVQKSNLRVVYVINTHGHMDHTLGNGEVARRTGAKVVMHKGARLEKDVAVKDGDAIELGKLRIEVIHTPGHSPDHICLLVEKKLLTGDTLFVGECGRTDLQGGNSEDLYESLFNKLMRLPDDVEIYPGHDYGPEPSSTIGYQRRNNYVLQPRSKQEFVSFMSEP